MDPKSRHLIEAALVVVGLVAAIVLIYGLGSDIILAGPPERHHNDFPKRLRKCEAGPPGFAGDCSDLASKPPTQPLHAP